MASDHMVVFGIDISNQDGFRKENLDFIDHFFQANTEVRVQ
jgi:hypothetical protein